MEENEAEMRKGFKALNKASGSFESSELMPNNAMYIDSMRKLDARAAAGKAITDMTEKAVGADFMKSASIAGAATGSTDKALIPLWVDPSIIDMTRRLTPMVELMPRVTQYGRTAEFNRLTARGVRLFGTEDESLAETDDTYARTSKAVKFVRQVGRITGPYQAASKFYLQNGYIDAFNLEVMNKSKTMRFVEEDTLINGNVDTARTAYGGGTSTVGAEYDGILNTDSLQTVAGGSATVTIDGLRQAIREARTADESTTLGQSNPDSMLTDFKTLDDIKALLQDYQRIVPADKIAWGFQAVLFDGLPIIPSKFMPVTTNSRALVVMDSTTWQMRVLQDMTYEELAKTNDSYKFMVKMYETLICTAPEYNCKITSLK